MVQVIPTSVFGVWADGTLLCRVVATGEVVWATNQHSYPADQEHWFVKDALTNVHGLLKDAQSLTFAIVAHSPEKDPPSQDVIKAAEMAEDGASCRLIDESRLEEADWALDDPQIPGAMLHYFFQDPTNDDPQLVRLALATDPGKPEKLVAIVWFAKSRPAVYSPNPIVTLTRVAPGANGKYPGTGTFYHHRTQSV